MTAHVRDGTDPDCDRCWDVEIDSRQAAKGEGA